MDLKIRDIAKDFGDTAALHGVDLDVRSGELLALLGPSGSGKTTLLRIVAGLEFPTRGTVHFGAVDASRKSVRDRNVGFVFQHYALFKHMTVFENVAFGLRVRPSRTRPPEAEIRKTVETLLELVQLPHLAGRYPTQLSGGQRQRVALARALAIDPQVLLLDEPFGALDAKVRKELRQWLRDLHKQTGHTTLFVTHDQDEALELADRIVVMSNGRIEQLGTPDEVYDEPASPFVYDFIGESSHLDVEIQEGRPYLDDRPIMLPFNDTPDGRATVFFRPQHARVVEPGPNLITGTVRSLHRRGATRRLELAIGAGARIVEADCDEHVPVRIGERAGLHIERARAFPTAA
jgi:sulfate transport system ATP-binding protein